MLQSSASQRNKNNPIFTKTLPSFGQEKCFLTQHEIPQNQNCDIKSALIEAVVTLAGNSSLCFLVCLLAIFFRIVRFTATGTSNIL